MSVTGIHLLWLGRPASLVCGVLSVQRSRLPWQGGFLWINSHNHWTASTRERRTLPSPAPPSTLHKLLMQGEQSLQSIITEGKTEAVICSWENDQRRRCVLRKQPMHWEIDPGPGSSRFQCLVSISSVSTSVRKIGKRSSIIFLFTRSIVSVFLWEIFQTPDKSWKVLVFSFQHEIDRKMGNFLITLLFCFLSVVLYVHSHKLFLGVCVLATKRPGAGQYVWSGLYLTLIFHNLYPFTLHCAEPHGQPQKFNGGTDGGGRTCPGG